MKILLLHTDFVEWEPKKKAIKTADDVEKGKVRVEDALVVMSAVEKDDEKNPDKIVGDTVIEIIKVLEQVKAKNVVIYPYAHLSPNLSSPHTAMHVLERIEQELSKKKIPIKSAPFGWYKAFNLSCKGHPLSELSKQISAKEEQKKDVKTITGKTHLSREELSENDHRILGQKLDLYSFQEVAPGMVFFHPKGKVILNNMIEFWRQEHVKYDYKEINTPLIMNKNIWEISGHWDHYKENMFFTNIDEVDFAVKPMNCPGAILVYKNGKKSYRDLPLKLAELGLVHRNELSGVLSGLFRLRAFTQDDAHIFVTEEQLEKEIENVAEMVTSFYKKFGFKFDIELSTRPEKAMGSKEIWDKAEKALEDSLKKLKMNYKLNPGDGAFYGPKIDFHIKDSLGRSWQCATIQVDFQMPQRFDISYTGKDNKEHRPVIIHRVLYGAIERFLGILVEHYKGDFPIWLAPVQVKVLSFTERNIKAAEALGEELKKIGFRIELDIRNDTLDYKVRDAEVHKIPYTIVIGDKEEKAGTLAIRTRGHEKVEFGVKKDDFIKKLINEIWSKA
ncbi:MAG: threonine--tRNA ligase [Candidatus Aenigmatarchaeota archaeon]